MAPKTGYHVKFDSRADKSLRAAAVGVGITVNAVIKQLVAFGLDQHPIFGKKK